MVGTGGDVGEFISQRADTPPGIAGVGIVETAQKDVQSGLLVLLGSLFRKAGAAALHSFEVPGIPILHGEVKAQEQFILRIGGIVVAVVAFTEAYPCNTDGASFADEFIILMLICEIPSGQIATEKALMECLAAAYGKSGLEMERCLTAVKDMLEEKYPYWRLVSQRGHLLSVFGKDTQRAKLEAEGHAVIQPDPDKDSYIVENYKEHLYDFGLLSITCLDDPHDFVQAATPILGR